MSSILQNLAKDICPLLLWCFWLAAVSIEGLPASMLHRAITEEDHSKECTETLIIFHRRGWFSHLLLFLNKDHLFAVRSLGAFKRAKRYNGTCLSDYYRTAQAEVQTQLVRPEFQNRIVTWQTSSHPDVFPLGHISEPAAGAYQECYFTSLKSLKRFKDL